MHIQRSLIYYMYDQNGDKKKKSNNVFNLLCLHLVVEKPGRKKGGKALQDKNEEFSLSTVYIVQNK